MRLTKSCSITCIICLNISRIMLIIYILLFTGLSFSQTLSPLGAPPAPGGGIVKDAAEAPLDNNIWLLLIVLFAVSWGIKKTRFFHQKQDG